MVKDYQCLVFDDDINDQAKFCMQVLSSAYLSAQTAVRMLEQDTTIGAKKLLCEHEQDLRALKFWVDYLLEKNSCSSCTETP